VVDRLLPVVLLAGLLLQALVIEAMLHGGPRLLTKLPLILLLAVAFWPRRRER
jgi:hypothetical protein